MPPYVFSRGWLFTLLSALFILGICGTCSNFAPNVLRIPEVYKEDYLWLSDWIHIYAPGDWGLGPAFNCLYQRLNIYVPDDWGFDLALRWLHDRLSICVPGKVRPDLALIWLYDTLNANIPEGWRPGPGLELYNTVLLWICCTILTWRTVLSIKCIKCLRVEEQIRNLTGERRAAQQEISGLHKKIEDLKRQIDGHKKTLSSSTIKVNQMKDSLKACEASKLSLAEDSARALEKEHSRHKDELAALRKELQDATQLLKETQSSLQEKLTQEEAKFTSEIQALQSKMCEMKEQQKSTESLYISQINELKSQLSAKTTGSDDRKIKFHQKRADENLRAYCETAQELERERRKSRDLQKNALPRDRMPDSSPAEPNEEADESPLMTGAEKKGQKEAQSAKKKEKEYPQSIK